jgi:FkbM family methyltransferase
MAMHYSGDIVVHVGANNGQEVMIYENSSILGYHIEAIPKIYEELNAKCLVTKSQIAICACLADEPGKEVTFNIASNNALSSSIFPLGRHKVEYPDISYTETHLVTTTTLDELIETGAIKQVPDHIVIDTQGAELLVLMGSIRTLKKERLSLSRSNVLQYLCMKAGPPFAMFLGS